MNEKQKIEAATKARVKIEVKLTYADEFIVTATNSISHDAAQELLKYISSLEKSDGSNRTKTNKKSTGDANSS